MASFWSGALLGILTGATAAALLLRAVRARRNFRSKAKQKADVDHVALQLQLAAHTAAIQHQVGQFADSLAGDDMLLRERLRRFERGGGQP